MSIISEKQATYLRNLQDKLLSMKITRKYIKEHGYDYPLFGEGSPTADNLMLYIYPQYKERIERVIENK